LTACAHNTTPYTLKPPEIRPSSNEQRNVWTAVLPPVDNVQPEDYQIMKITINGGGSIAPVKVDIFGADDTKYPQVSFSSSELYLSDE
jgi:hypothetical protein